jgi:2-isopropylmalate synthase
MRVTVLDSTLRDGVQGGDISFSVEDKLRIAQKLDAFGVDYIEAGWPGSNPADAELFRRAQSTVFQNARLTAFGPVCAANRSAADDPQVRALLDAATPAVTVHANFIELRKDPRLVERIRDTVSFLKQNHREVLFDAAHFFDSYEMDEAASLEALETACEAGADVLVLCDTAGGTLPKRLAEVCGEVRVRLECPLGIHTHNEGGLALANILAAIGEGFQHVQGCVNGYGDRAGSADLCGILGNLDKLGVETACSAETSKLRELAVMVAELAHLPLRADQPFVGGGVERRPATLEDWMAHFDFAAKLSDRARREVADRVRHLEMEGYDLAAADGTVELLLREAAHPEARLFEVSNYEVVTRGIGGFGSHTTATVSLEVNEAVISATAEGNGPIHALEQALRQCLAPLYPSIAQVRMTNYQLRVLDPQRGSAAKARVLIEWAAPDARWSTLGVSDNLITASWLALVDAMRLELLRLAEIEPLLAAIFTDDASWAV